MRFGSVSLVPAFRLLEFGIDTNVFNQAGRQDSDFTTTLQPRLEVRMKRPTLDLSATGRVAFVYYRKYSSERSVNPSFAFEGEHRPSTHLKFRGGASVGYDRERNSLEIDTRARRKSEGVELGIGLSGRKLMLDLTTSARRLEYNAEAQFAGVRLAPELDRATRTAILQAGYRATPFTTLTMAVEAVADRFADSRTRNLDRYRALIGVQFKSRAILSGGGAVGYQVARPFTGGPDISGPSGQGGVTYTWRDHLSVSAGAERNIDFSFRADSPFYVYEIYDLALRQSLVRRLDVGVGLSRGSIAYQGERQRGLATELRSASASVGVRVSRESRISAYVTQWERRSGDFPYRTVRTGIQATLWQANVNERGVFMHGPRR